MELNNEQKKEGLDRGVFNYDKYCSTCHGKSLEGNAQSGYPSLVNIDERLELKEILNIIDKGKGMMPGFNHLEDLEINSIMNYLNGIKSDTIGSSELYAGSLSVPYKHKGYKKFLDANGLPAISPPWGTLNAIDLNTGEFVWKNTFGEIDSLVALGHPITGSENYGGPIITENGLLIIAATVDAKARIYDRFSGKLLWSDILPAASFATPSTYDVAGQQFIVFACGGEKLNTKPGNKLVAYTLR